MRSVRLVLRLLYIGFLVDIYKASQLDIPEHHSEIMCAGCNLWPGAHEIK
jgi:hypothetical protein